MSDFTGTDVLKMDQERREEDAVSSRRETTAILQAVKAAGEDFEFYPTTQAMIDVVARHLPMEYGSIMDIGAGDGRVLRSFAAKIHEEKNRPTLYAIEKSTVLVGTWPEQIIPVGTEFFEQNLACLQTDFIFCNPPYSEYEQWVETIVETGYAQRAFLVIPQRWVDSPQVANALKKRGAKAKIIHTGDFLDADRRARAVIHIVEITYPVKEGYRYDDKEPQDPFDAWFDANVSTFDEEKVVTDEAVQADLAKKHDLNTITGLVDAFNEEYARMQENYKAIFKLDYQILKELGVKKGAIHQGLKARMAGLKTQYWQMLFDRLTTITSRLCAATKKKFLEKLTGRAGIAFTANNAYAVVIWAIKHANRYFDEQLIKFFKDISVQEGIKNYKSNQRVWAKDRWRFRDENASHYALDYRFVVEGYRAICTDSYAWDYPGGLSKDRHELIGDAVAVLGNLGFITHSPSSYVRKWIANDWQDYQTPSGDILVQVKAFKNGNVHWRFMPEAIKALNVEAGRLLGWIHTPADVVAELGYEPAEAEKYFRCSQKILPSNVKLLLCGGAA